MTFEQVRIPAALILLVVAVVVLLPRGGEADAGTSPPPSRAVVVGQPGGGILSTPSVGASPAETPSVTAVPSLAPTATPAELPDTFSAEVFACRDLDGAECRGELENIPRRSDRFTALVLFSDARAGDTISVVLTGPETTLNGGPFTLEGGGDGYYYSEIIYGDDLPDGEYVLVATRNGEEVARATLRNND